jgi:hypothetical protein
MGSKKWYGVATDKLNKLGLVTVPPMARNASINVNLSVMALSQCPKVVHPPINDFYNYSGASF